MGRDHGFFFFFFSFFQFCDVAKWLKIGKEKDNGRESIIPFSIYFKILSKRVRDQYAEESHKMAFGFSALGF
jgi:hypothetical protein